MICRGVVIYVDRRTLWCRLVYALMESGYAVIDALSAALMVKETKIAKEIRLDAMLTNTLVALEFHTTSWHGQPSYRSDWAPQAGEIVEVHLNTDNKLVSVWYAPR